MNRYIKDFLLGMVVAFYRMTALLAIPAGIYLLCILHTSPCVWLGIATFFMAIFLIVIGVVVTWLFGWYDRTLDEDSDKLKKLLEEKKDE